ncbi:MAG: hypothetical protein HY368_02960 [Candidatus Aenigmarchaeota archaeon]|nr:hypothetical protein [Candidatus Aenigmarchaeota archaeon]
MPEYRGRLPDTREKPPNFWRDITEMPSAYRAAAFIGGFGLGFTSLAVRDYVLGQAGKSTASGLILGIVLTAIGASLVYSSEVDNDLNKPL